MERQTEGTATFPPFMQKLIARGYCEGYRKGYREGYRKGYRETLLGLTARAGIALTEEERARVQGCEETEILWGWIEKVLGARTAADIFS